MKIGIQNIHDVDDYFGDNPQRVERLKGLKLSRVPGIGERLLFRDRAYLIEHVVTDLEDNSVTVLVKHLPSKKVVWCQIGRCVDHQRCQSVSSGHPETCNGIIE